MSTRENILAAFATVLASVAGGRVYRSRREQLPTLPAVIIRPLSESAEETVLGLTDRRLLVAIGVLAKGEIPDSAIDTTLAAVWTALAPANALGLGSEVQIEPAHEIDWDEEDYDYGRATLRITVIYRTAIGSM
jgi:hypothetical protein